MKIGQRRAKPPRVKGPAKRGARPTTKAAHGELPQWTPAEIEEAFRRFAAANPEPRGELQHVNPFTLLVAVVLSAQATDAGVNKATPALFKLADTPEKMVALGEAKRARSDQDHRAVSHQGEERGRAVAECSSTSTAAQVPHDREALEALPGVGRKTANVVLNIAFGEPTIAVDTHIFRVGNRTGLAVGKTPLDVEMKLMEVVPEAISAARPSLADPARPLYLRGAPPAVREMHHRRSVQMAGEDSRASGRRGKPLTIGLAHANSLSPKGRGLG